MKTRSLAFLILDGYEPLDLTGPMSAFAAANQFVPEAYELMTCAMHDAPIAPNCGPRVLADCKIDELEKIHTLVLVGGEGPRTYVPVSKDKLHIERHIEEAQRVLTVCTGAFLAGRFGLLDEREVTTHWRYQEDLQRLFPAARVARDSLYCSDGKLWTTAGVTSGIDAALALIRADFGAGIAANVARQLVVYLHRPGGQEQYAQDLQIQSGCTAVFADVTDWIANNLDADLSVGVLARRARMSQRTFQRRFRRDFGTPVSTYVEQLRVRHAGKLLTSRNVSVAATAYKVGFDNPDTFRRAFERQMGVSPSFYRKRFETFDD